MNILQIVSQFVPAWGFGGPVRHVYERSKALIARGHQVTVCTTDAQIGGDGRLKVLKNTPVEVDGIETYYLANLSNHLSYKYNINLPLTVVPIMRQLVPNCNVVHMHGLYSILNIVAHYYSTRNDIPYVLSTGNVFPPKQVGGRVGIKTIFLFLRGKKILADVNRIIALTDEEKNLIVQSGIPPDKVAVEPFGIDMMDFESGRSKLGSFRQEYGIDADEFVILFVGRIHKGKGIPMLVRSFSNLPAALQQRSRLVIVGPDSNDRQAVDEAIAACGVSARVLFTGLLSGDTKFAAFTDADIFVLPSFEEELPRAVLEASASGVPVIITDRCNVPLVSQYQAGYVISPDQFELQNVLQDLLSSPQLRHTLGLNGRQMVEENFNWERVAQRLENIYQQVAINK